MNISLFAQDRSIAMDLYQANAEFYDLSMGSMRQHQQSIIRSIFSGIDAADGLFIELGAGTGLATAVLAEALPDVQIVAIEPSAYLRPILMSRVVRDADLRSRITVQAGDFAAFIWPDQISGFAAFAMIGHLTPDERHLLLGHLARSLSPNGRAVIELMLPHEATVVGPSLHMSERVGSLDYEAFNEAEPVADDLLRWSMTFRVLRDGVRVREQTAESLYRTIAPATLLAEAKEAGLVGDVADSNLIVLHRR
jgi:SAM-dependent methyltransferase